MSNKFNKKCDTLSSEAVDEMFRLESLYADKLMEESLNQATLNNRDVADPKDVVAASIRLKWEEISS